MFPAKSVTWRGWGYGAGRTLVSRGWFVPPEATPPTPPPPPPPAPTPRPPRRSITKRGGIGGGGAGGRIRARRKSIECELEPPKIYVHFPETEADYALLTITEGATVRALSSGQITHFYDARGQLALKLEADDGTNYYYADLSCYVGAADRRVEAGEAIAKSAHDAVPEITQASQTKALPARAGNVSESPQLRVVAPVFVEPTKPTRAASPPPRRMLVKLVPISPPPAPPSEWEMVRAPERRQNPAIALVTGIGAIAALLYALSRPPSRPKRRKKRTKRTRRG